MLKRNLRRTLALGNLEEAEAVLAQLKSEDPLSVETRGAELELLLRSRRLGEAERLARQLVESFPASPRILYLAAEAAYRRRDYAAAERWARESDRLHPHWRARRLLGQTLTQIGHLDEAEAVLTSLLGEHPVCHRDLAWLYERKGEVARALKCVEAYRRDRPEDAALSAQRQRLRARQLDADELLDEIEGLVALGEDVPAALVPEYAEALLRGGRVTEVRRFVGTRSGSIDSTVRTRLAWVCYRHQAHDLAFDLFVGTFREHRDDRKFLSAFEAAARRSGRLEEVIELYGEHAPEARHLYGRVRRLRSPA